MCGLVGIAAKNMTKSHVKAFEMMLYLDTIRGWDSTGIAMISLPASRKNVDHVFAHKRAITGMEFLGTRAWNKIGNTAVQHGRVLMGHNRAATKGAVCDMNAHPFQHGNITLMHNGSLNRWRDIAGHKNEFTVDSEAICWALSQTDTYEEMDDVLEDINGAFALTFHDADDDTLNFVRNSERPLVWANVYPGNYKGAKPNGIMWASESEFIAIAARKAGLTIGKINWLPVGKHVRLSVDTLEVVDERDVEVYDPAKKKVTVVHSAHKSNTSSGGKSTSTPGASGPSNGKSVKPHPDIGQYFEFVSIGETWKSYGGNHVDEKVGYMQGYGVAGEKFFRVTLHNIPESCTKDGVWRGKCTSMVPFVGQVDPNEYRHTIHTSFSYARFMGEEGEPKHGKERCRPFVQGSKDCDSEFRAYIKENDSSTDEGSKALAIAGEVANDAVKKIQMASSQGQQDSK